MIMEDIFAKINSTDGVLGVYVCDALGAVQYSSSQAVDDDSFGEISNHSAELGYLFDSLSDTAGLSEITLLGHERLMLLKKEGNYFLLVLSVSSVNVAALGVLLNTVLPKMRQALSDRESTTRSAGPKELAGKAGVSKVNLVAVPPSKARLLRESHQAASRAPAVSQKGISKIGDWQAGPVPPDAVGIKFVNHMYAVCEDYFGQSAREILIREMKGLGTSPSSLSVTLVQDLIEKLVANVEDTSKRKKFRDKILGDD
jgi:hypothetical protein